MRQFFGKASIMPRPLPFRSQRGASARLAAALLLHAAAAAAAAPYQPGRGWNIPDTDWTVGGYATGVLDDPEGESPTLDLSHLSLLLWWDGAERFKFFSELDWQDSLSVQHSPLSTSDEYLALERLYFDYAYDDSVNVRVGKFLTPIGRWNLIHADPLVWTTSRPLVTEASFPTNITGAMVFGSVDAWGRSIDYSVYTDIGDEIRPNPNTDSFEHAVGAHLGVPVSQYAQVGLSYANFEQSLLHEGRKNLLGADFVWSRDRYELSAEFVYSAAERDSSLDEKGLYLQAVVPLTQRLYAVARFEPFRNATYDLTRVWVAGVALRINPALVFKAEYVHPDNNQPYVHRGFLSSLSVLF